MAVAARSLGTVGPAFTVSVRVLTPDRREWRDGELDLSALTVTVGTEVVPRGRIQRICHRRHQEGEQATDDEGIRVSGQGRFDLNPGYLVLLGLIVSNIPRTNLEEEAWGPCWWDATRTATGTGVLVAVNGKQPGGRALTPGEARRHRSL